MRLLFVTPYLPGPPLFGGARRIHGLMTQLAQRHELSLLSLVGLEDQTQQLAAARTYCREVETVQDGRHQLYGRPKRIGQLASVLSPWSWEHAMYHRPALQRALDRQLDANDYDVVVCEFGFMASLRFHTRKKRPRLLLDEHNVEYDLLRRTTKIAEPSRRAFQELNWRKLRREEHAAWRRFDACALTSERDAEIVQREVPGSRIAVVPNGVDVDSFSPRADHPLVENRLLFFGAINYFPNHDAALYFAQHIFPQVLSLAPEARLRIVGPVDAHGPVTDLRQDQRIEVMGFVDDVTAEIASAAVVIVPLRSGGGTRLKILEAMSMGKAIVSTRLGAEGIDVEHERDILLADTPEDFAHQVKRVLADPALRARLGAAARHTAQALYSWSASAARMEQLLSSLMTHGGRR